MIHQENPSEPDFEYFEQQTTQYLPPSPGRLNYEIRFTAQVDAYFPWSTGNFAAIPFEVWRIGDVATPDDDYRVFVFVRDLEANHNQGEFNITNIDHSVSTLRNDPMTDSFYLIEPWNTAPGDSGYQTFRRKLQSLTSDEILTAAYWQQIQEGVSRPGVARLAFVNLNGGYVVDTEKNWQEYDYNAFILEPGTIFQILGMLPFSVEDKYRITAKPVMQSAVVERQVVEQVTVYPNPYIAGHPLERGREQVIYFYHLPRKVEVRVFSLNGELVRRLYKEDESQFLRWNLRNSAGRRVASGIYIAHLRMTLSDGSIVEKVLKIAIVQGRERY